MSIMKCEKCGFELAVDDVFCPKCGTKKEVREKICGKCNQTLSPDDEFCFKCGVKREEDDTFCINCSQVLIFGDEFCSKCGTKSIKPSDIAGKPNKSTTKIVLSVGFSIFTIIIMIAVISAILTPLTPNLTESRVQVVDNRGISVYVRRSSNTEVVLELTWSGYLYGPFSYRLEKKIDGIWFEQTTRLESERNRVSRFWGDYLEVIIIFNPITSGDYRIVFNYILEDGDFIYGAAEFSLN